MQKKVLGTLFILIALIGWGPFRIIQWVQFDRQCEGYLKRAADANTVELAKKQLQVALAYIEKNHLTRGYTSIIYQTPDEDIGFWHANIQASLDELNTISPQASQLEKSNMLLKLRETLIDHSSSGVEVTVPPGISVFPNNIGVAAWSLISLVLAALGVWLFYLGTQEKYRQKRKMWQ